MPFPFHTQQSGVVRLPPSLLHPLPPPHCCTFPPPCSRVGLGLGGVCIVAASVIGALGLISAAGLWSTLIIMEV